MESSKNWYLSKTIQGNIVALVGMLIKWTGLPVLESEASTIVAAIFMLAGVGYAIYGRFKATTVIK